MARPIRLLLVEDNPDDVAHVDRLIHSTSRPVERWIAGDGKEAIDLLADRVSRGREGLPDLVILDLNLPRMSGLEALQWIRADQRLQDLPVVVLTGASEEGQILRMHRLGVLGYLVKPLNAEEFGRIVEGLFVSLSF